MKKLFLLALLCGASLCKAQNDIFISVVQPSRQEIPAEVSEQLANRLQQIVATNGISTEDPTNRFVITVKTNVLTKDILPGPPQKVAQKIEIVFKVGDIVENRIYETYSLTALGVGQNETKSFLSAIKNIKPQNAEFIQFLERAKRDIRDYYAQRCPQIIVEAQQLAAAQNYSEAIYNLMLVPDFCEGAKECQNLAIQYNIELTNNRAAQMLNEAKALWARSPNAEGASSVADIIAKVPAGTPSQQGVDALTKEMAQKLKADERKDWEFKLQQYRDRKEQERREFALRAEQQQADNIYRREQQAENNAARRQSIEACRQVGLAWAKNQPRTIINRYQKNIIYW